MYRTLEEIYQDNRCIVLETTHHIDCADAAKRERKVQLMLNKSFSSFLLDLHTKKSEEVTMKEILQNQFRILPFPSINSES